MKVNKYLIYVVDDDAAARSVTCLILKAQGMRARSFASVEECLRAFSYNPADCVIVDLRMPKAHDADLQEALTARGIRIPVVMMAGDPASAQNGLVNAAGSSAVLHKPLDARTVEAIIENAIARSCVP
ncbi:response regulator transcription factor [Nevskia soli]|uniref:response regulator transcription factor n=1 Tax=Nevskia soli TaxID=418856 RepID=UPI00146FD930|nr:response regulator [Nevskia soli]